MSRRASGPLVAALDGLLAMLAFVLAFKIQYGWDEAMFTRWGNLTWLFLPYVVPLAILPWIRVSLAWRSGAYQFEGAFSLVDDVLRVFRNAALGSLALVVVAALSRDQRLWQWLATWHRDSLSAEEAARLRDFFRSFNYSRKVFLLDCLLYAGVGAAFWVAVRQAQLAIRRRGRNLLPVLLVGDTTGAKALRRAIETDLRLGRRLVAHVSDIRSDQPKDILRRIRRLLADHPAEEVILSGLRISHPQLFQLVMECDTAVPVDMKFLPDLAELSMRKIRVGRLGDIPLFALMEDPIGRVNRTVKRVIDIVGATLLLVLLFPAFLVIGLLIKRDTPGPVIYKGRRVGRDGHPFTCYKFRSMTDSVADDRHREFMARVIRGAAEVLPDGRKIYKERNDPRITRVGRVLRRYSLDELPQVFNVLKGDMSLVGPRPPVQYEVEQYEEWQRGRLATRPGITGLWQVSGRNEISFEDMVQLDMFYIENYSLWLDFRIMMQTVPAVFRGSGN